MSAMRLLACTALLLPFLTMQARAESKHYPGDGENTLPNRMALLVGVPTYFGPWDKLDNVNRDLPKVKEAFEAIGFTPPRVVDSTSAADGRVTRAIIYQRLYQFAEEGRKAPGSLLVFYFAGHGFTHDGRMYLVPADAPITYAEDPARFAIPLADVVTIIKAAKPLAAVIIVDACRDLPFARLAPLSDPASSRDLQTGGEIDRRLHLEDTEPTIGIIYSATKGQKALDGPTDGTSYFASALVDALNEAAKLTAAGNGSAPRITVHDVSQDLIARVQQMSGFRQTPRPDLPYAYRLPIFSTERAYREEETAWRQLTQQTDLGTLVQLYPKLNLETANAKIYCLRFDFLRAYGYSYFWKQASRLLDEVYSKENAQRCSEKGNAAAAPLFAPQSAAVVAPNGDISDRQVRTQPIEFAKVLIPGPASASANLPVIRHATDVLPRPTPDSPAATPVAPPLPSPERKLLLEAANATSNSKVLLSTSTALAQANFFGPGRARAVPLPAGESVTFIQFVDPAHEVARVFHDSHGFGNVPTAALASLNAVIRVALSYDSGQIEPSDKQQEILAIQLAGARAVKAVSTSIRYAREDGPIGFRRAQAITNYLRTSSKLPVDRGTNFIFPTMVDAPDLDAGLLTLAIVVETGAPTPAERTLRVERPLVINNAIVDSGPSQMINNVLIEAARPSRGPIAVRVFDVQRTH